MPVEFLSDEQAARYGRYHQDPTPEQLSQFFYLSEADLLLIAERRRKHNKLGFAVQLCTLRYLGTFLANPVDVPSRVVATLAQQLGLKPEVLPGYLARFNTRFTHQGLILAATGYRAFDPVQAFRLIRWLYRQIAVSTLRPSVLFDLATAHLIGLKVVLPGVTTLARLIARVRERFNKTTYEALSQRLSDEQRLSLDALLVLEDGERLTPFEVLRTPPTRISAPALLAALERVERIRAVGIAKVDLSDVPDARQAILARHAQTSWAQTLARMNEDRRLATLLVFVQTLERTATDDVLDLFDALLGSLLLKGEIRQRRDRLRTLKDLDQAALVLQDAVRVLLDEGVPETGLRAAVYARLGEDRLREAVSTVQELATSEHHSATEALIGSYTTVRRFLPALLRVVTLDGTPGARPLLDAWTFLNAQETKGRGRPKWTDAPRGVVGKAWEHRVFPTNSEVDSQAYTLCVLERLQVALKRREVFVPNSDRYSDPRAELLQGQVWESARLEVTRALDRSTDPAVELASLELELSAAYAEVARHLPDNTALELEQVDGHEHIRLSPLEAQPEPETLLQLRDQVSLRLPQVDLAAVLLEIQALTGFTDAFTHVTGGASQVNELGLSVCAVLLAQACNLPLKAVARQDVSALSLSRLSWVAQNYVRAETLSAANVRLVEAQSALPLAQVWGGGEVASADGMRFVVPVRTLNAGWNSKYFGAQRGVTYYNFTSDQFTGFHGIVIPGTLRDSLFILSGLLEQQTRLDPREIMSDTHGSSDVVFGLFALLGYRFSPRLADLADQRFWRIDPHAEYGVLNDLSRHRINTRLIAEHWDDLLRLAGSLKLGKVKATSVMRTLQRGGSLSGLGRAAAELGRIEKTLYLLAYVHDESYRRRILVQLNRGEGRHSVARAVFHGRKGELRQKYREGMEDQLGALGLVVNVMVLWNTRYIQAALEGIGRQGIPVRAEDAARLSPLLHEHINMLGRYEFNLPDEVARGQLRPLRGLETLDDFLP